MLLQPAAALQRLMFICKFIRSPRQIGSVTPSSKALCKKMVESIDWSQVRYAAELGAGTGVITRRMLEAAPEETKVLLFEKDAQLRSGLAQRYPEFPCFAEACRLNETVRNEGLPYLDCILSGLPFANFKPDLREELLGQIEQSLKPGGYFVAFQYSLQMKRALKRRFDVEHIHMVVGNVPPAFVYVCRKRVGLQMDSVSGL